ncbi:MAG: cysteine--tRNA ligase [Alphaproteobacteria bacterium]|uniref:Cysteine--tRNA ligase n=1 Tax=PS1 clade bacterium TaxID=2175152 RepID=A0A368DPQ8_9PROT|nr:cysteine--tRNA ligase [Rhodobiaceae bacterium]OUT73604.1 MAG: cysteine--tRNA ligase [Rhizobiales bacterium TMED25]RCL73263.1 MAG: cysteine--tRNA ligase [PS1 clade bacterium]|tara:strand:- start:3594 stop:4961 length:1368 start_codon:yes stop_codon:yes gene_type:complete
MDLFLYNSISREKEMFIPIDSKNIRMYVCGPTVYDSPHIGNARPVIIFDLLYRLLRYKYGNDKVQYIRNITDVDDKINKIALEKYPDIDINDAISQLTKNIEYIFKDNAKKLNCLNPTLEPRATDHIRQMIEMIKKLIDSDKAYVSDRHVLFSINSHKNYGSLSKKSQKDLLAGARVEIAKYKENPLDFVLWKPSQINEPYWDSPWGKGRPGWHIECSAMSSEYFGSTFDIHGGGIDLIFPHHENEIAQSCSYHSNKKMANFFMHNGSLNLEGKKMSKSTGNIVSLGDLLGKYSGPVIRLAMLSTHYRQPIDWTEKNLQQSKNILKKWSNKLNQISNKDSKESIPEGVYKSLLDDLNTPQALSHMHKYFNNKEYDKLKNSIEIMGFTSHSLTEGNDIKSKNTQISELEILTLIDERKDARTRKDYKKSDEIRNKLEIRGIRLQDEDNETTWEFIE